MGWREWEGGSIKLPDADYARIRREIVLADNTHKDKVLGLARDFWQTLDEVETTDRAAYFRAQRDYFRIQGTKSNIAPEVLAESFGRTSLRGQDIPRCLLRANMDYPSETTTTFSIGRARINFDSQRKSILWSVPAGCEAAKLAHDHPTACALFMALRYVHWTSDTGGWIEGNDETNRDYNADGALMPAYTPVAWGPVGAKAHPSACEPFSDASGAEITREVLAAL